MGCGPRSSRRGKTFPRNDFWHFSKVLPLSNSAFIDPNCAVEPPTAGGFQRQVAPRAWKSADKIFQMIREMIPIIQLL
jgi:hypothetical protein